MLNENKFILELCKFKNAEQEQLVTLMEHPLDYPYILGHLLYNRVGGIAYYVLKKYGLLHRVNREFRNTIKSIYETNLEKTNSFIKALKGLSPVCKRLAFPYALLKGAYLVDLYPRGLRTSNDIDILIEPQNITKLSVELKLENFEQGHISNEEFVPANRMEIISSRMNRGETVPFVKEISLPRMRHLEIDVNFSLGFRPGLDNALVHDFLQNTPLCIQGGLATLDKIDFLIHLCAHLYKEATVMKWVEMGRDISLYKYCDIYLFIQTFGTEDFWDTLVQRVNSIGLQKECYYAIFYTKMLFSIENQAIDVALGDIKPVDLAFLKQIVEPSTDKIYAFDMDYVDWVFCGNRKEHLHEIENV